MSQPMSDRALLRAAVKEGCALTVFQILGNNGNLIRAADEEGLTPLHHACQPNEVESRCQSGTSYINYPILAYLLSYSDPDIVNAQDSFGNTALHYAAKTNNSKVVQMLIAHGARREVGNCDGMIALHLAIQFNCKYTFRSLNLKENLNAKNKDGNTPLHLSVINSNNMFTKELVQKNANVNCQNNWGQTLLHTSYERNNLHIVNLLLDSTNFDSFNNQDTNGDTILHFVALQNDYKLLDTLVSKGANLDLTNCNGQTPLHIAVSNNCTQALDLLISLGADLNIQDGEGKTPLHISVSKRVLSVVGRLVASGADLELRDIYDRTPIHYAANCESLELLKHLYLSGSQTSVNYLNQTLIHVAILSCPVLKKENCHQACHKCCVVIDWLLHMGVDINAQDVTGYTIFHYGAWRGCLGVLKQLHNKQTKYSNFKKTFGLLELQNNDGQTALHIAALCNNWQVFDHLIGENADPDSKDNKGVTPFEILIQTFESKEFRGVVEAEDMNTPLVEPMIYYFVSARLPNIVDLLLKRNVSTETRYNGDTLLIYAIKRGRIRETQVILDRGADVNAQNDTGLTALHVAIIKYNVSTIYITIVDILILAGADVNVKSHDGQTALHLVLKNRRVYPYLLDVLLGSGAIIDVLDYNRKTPLDYISSWNMENPRVKTLLERNLIMLKAVNMLSTPSDFHYEENDDFYHSCVKEIELMKNDRHGRNSLYDVFLHYQNPIYIFNKSLEVKINANDICEIYKIYGSALNQTYKRGKKRYKLLQDALSFFKLITVSPFQPSLPVEVQRLILQNLSDNDLETLIKFV